MVEPEIDQFPFLRYTPPPPPIVALDVLLAMTLPRIVALTLGRVLLLSTNSPPPIATVLLPMIEQPVIDNSVPEPTILAYTPPTSPAVAVLPLTVVFLMTIELRLKRSIP